MNYRIKQVYAKRDDDGKIYCYTVVAESKQNSEFTFGCTYTPLQMQNRFNCKTEQECLGLRGKDCNVVRSIVLE